MEEFLCGFELCDHELHFGGIALILGAFLASLDILDARNDGKITYKQLFEWSNKHAHADWLLCHYEALVKASLIPSDEELTRAALKHAERVFTGLALVQTHLRKDRIHIADLVELQHQPNLEVSEREAIAELILYLGRASKRGGDGSISAQELAEVSPELLWSNRE
jgi:hypothetical protein